MSARVCGWAVRCWLAACALGLAAGCAAGQTLVESSVEARFQLDFHVPDAALASFLPAGFAPAIATQGPAKDANLRVVFIDRISITGPDDKPRGRGSNRLVYLVAPVKDPSGMASQLVIGGITEDPDDAPGPFGVYLPAATHTVERTIGGAGSLDSQDWVFTAAGGERLELHIKFQRGPGNRFPLTDVRFYSAKNPGFYQISRQEQVLDVLRNVTTQPPDRVKEFSVKAGGGRYAKLFDGTEKMLSWDNIPWISRAVSLP